PSRTSNERTLPGTPQKRHRQGLTPMTKLWTPVPPIKLSTTTLPDPPPFQRYLGIKIPKNCHFFGKFWPFFVVFPKYLWNGGGQGESLWTILSGALGSTTLSLGSNLDRVVFGEFQEVLCPFV